MVDEILKAKRQLVAGQNQRAITIRGAREHNLKNIDVEIPRDKLVVLTGLSGSGKSSLAFDTIYAEGQRRYVESLSAYARQFLEMMQKPDVDQIDGLSPAISIEQKTTSKNPRSTVGTVTEIYDYMRLLWARVGVPYSPATGLPIESQTVSQMVDRVLALPEGTRLYLLAPVVRGRKGEYRKELAEYLKKGFQRVKIDGTFHELADAPVLDKKFPHDIDVVVDRIVVRPDLGQRLAESFETALKLAEGLAVIEYADAPAASDDKKTEKKTAKIHDKSGPERILFSEKFACPVSGFTIPEIEPRLFSFNNPYGACPACGGLGIEQHIDADLVIPDKDLTLRKGAIAPWAKSSSPYYVQTLQALGKFYKFTLDTKWKDLPKKTQNAILFGSGDDEIKFSYEDGVRSYDTKKPFEGVVTNIERRFRETESEWAREELGKYFSDVPCEACHGHRLKPEALCVKIGGKHIGEIAELSVKGAGEWFASVPDALNKQQNEIAGRVLKEIRERLSFLLDVGLNYLTLARSSGTLSGGESQRIRLASQIGSGLTGVLYVLDEPSIGLHQRDNRRLIDTLVKLKNLGNTLIVVEHDEDTIRTADWIVDIGPGAGEHGGKVVHSGAYDALLENHGSVTGDYLAGRRAIPMPTKRRKIDKSRQLTVEGAQANNLQNVTASFPLGAFVAVTGVSGSGKSSLVNDILYKVLANQLNGARQVPGRHKRVTGLEHLDKVVHVDQAPIGRTPRSNPATYTGVFDRIRTLFSETIEAKARGYQPGRFSFNVKGGRCENCAGDGTIKIEMNFLPDVYVQCEVCHGARYNRDTLQVHYKGKNIAEVLDMPISEAAEFFEPITAIHRYLKTLVDVGLGYVRLGQSATTLSGGEAQRVKLATELQKRSNGRSIYVLDEPTTGLHFEDVRKLLEVLNGLVDKGNSVIVIEHNLDVIKSADWIIDLGPEGGSGGGTIVATGTPEQVARNPQSHTGTFLAELLDADRSEQQSAGQGRRKAS